MLALKEKIASAVTLSALMLSILTASVTSFAGKIEVATPSRENENFGLIPEFLLDASGFKVEGDPYLSLLGADQASEPVPLFPIYEKGAFNQSFVGVKVPSEFFSGRPETAQQRNGTFTTVIGGRMNDRQSAIAEQLSKIHFDDGTKIVPYFFNGSLYGIRSDVRVAMGNQTTGGFFFSFGGGKTINLGSQNLIGGSLSIGGSTSFVGGEKGINIFSTFQKLFDLPSEIQSGDDQLEFYRRTLKFAPYIRHYLNRNAEGLRVPHSEYTAARLGGMNNDSLAPQKFELKEPVLVDRFSSELQSAMRDLKEPSNLSREVKWKEDVRGAVENQLVLKSEKANQFLQKICDHLSAAYGMPEDLRPRCRIAASLAPNAWAYPGGDIFVSVGLMGILSDLDSLRLVIGHEIGHVAGRHTSRALPGRMAFMYAANGVALAAQVGLGSFALAGGRGALGEVNWLTWFPQSMALSMSSAVVTQVGMEVLFLAPFAALMAHQRSLEWQADRFGHETALATGAKPEKLGEGWLEFKSFIETYLDPDGASRTSLLASHPNPKARFEETESRGPRLKESLGVYAVNRLPESYYHDYRELHLQFKPNVTAWGENALRKKRAGDSRAANYSMQSLLSPAGQCVIHALSGRGLFEHE